MPKARLPRSNADSSPRCVPLMTPDSNPNMKPPPTGSLRTLRTAARYRRWSIACSQFSGHLRLAQYSERRAFLWYLSLTTLPMGRFRLRGLATNCHQISPKQIPKIRSTDSVGCQNGSRCNAGRAWPPTLLSSESQNPVSQTTLWQVDADCLPQSLISANCPRDCWNGEPVAPRTVDTACVDRSGPIQIEFPNSGMQIRVTPSDNLSCTVVYVLTGYDYFCVQPVSHATDTTNRASETRKRRPACMFRHLRIG